VRSAPRETRKPSRLVAWGVFRDRCPKAGANVLARFLRGGLGAFRPPCPDSRGQATPRSNTASRRPAGTGAARGSSSSSSVRSYLQNNTETTFVRSGRGKYLIQEPVADYTSRNLFVSGAAPDSFTSGKANGVHQDCLDWLEAARAASIHLGVNTSRSQLMKGARTHAPFTLRAPLRCVQKASVPRLFCGRATDRGEEPSSEGSRPGPTDSRRQTESPCGNAGSPRGMPASLRHSAKG